MARGTPAAAAPAADFRPATLAEYLALGEDSRAEYLDGCIVMSPSPTRRHGDVVTNFNVALRASVPAGYAVAAQWSWRSGPDEFIPDVMVFADTDEDVRLTATPVLCIEVLSSNRADDLVRKTQKYAAAGVRYYWVVDLRDDVMTAYELGDDGFYRLLVSVQRGDRLPVTFGIGALLVDLEALL